MLIGVLIRGECENKLQQPGRSIDKSENFPVFDSWRLQDYRADPGNVLVFFIFGEKMVGSAAIKQGRLANRKHTYFLGALADPTIYRPKSKFLSRIALSSDYL